MKVYTILLIDDDEDEYLIFKDFLSDLVAKHTLIWANTYDKGLQLLREEKFDICFIDLNLGIKSGLDLYGEIKVERDVPPIILLTGQESRTIDLQAIESGVSDYIVKNSLSADVIDRSIRYSITRSNLVHNLLAEKDKYNSLFNTTLDPIALCKSDFKIYETNLAFRSILGIEYDSIENLLFEEFISELLNVKDESVRSVSEDGFKNHYFQVFAGEKLHHFLISAVKTSFDKNVPDGYQVIFHDIGQIIQAENDRSQKEKRVFTEKIAKLIAHEIRNPLSNINLAASELMDDEVLGLSKDENSRVFLDIIKRNALRINSLIDQLLDSSRPAELKFQKINVDNLVNSIIQISQDRIDLIDVKLSVQAEAKELFINADEPKLILAFSNIVNNAIEAMNQTENAELGFKYYSNNGNLVFEISDNGIGMSDENAKRVFEPFFTNKRGGKGLGMNLTQNIINEHGGDISITSSIGIGTTVIVRLKLNIPN